MTKTLTYKSESITVTFASGGCMSDYGVPHSPVWWEPTDIEVAELYILGEKQDFNKLDGKVKASILMLTDDFLYSDWE